jgi:light-regulated signal transduction histidine kinase (bacteriophytochrome)
MSDVSISLEQELAQCRAQLASNEQRWQKLVNFNADGIIVVSVEGAIRFANPAAETLLHRSLAKLVETPLGFPIVGGQTAEVEIVANPEKIVIAEMRAVCIEWENQMACLISLRDITSHRQAQDEIKELNASLNQRVKELDAFVYSVAHDLRAPLQSIRGFALALHEECQAALKAEGLDWLNRIQASAARMGQLLESLLEFARFSPMSLNRTDVDLAELVPILVQELTPAGQAFHLLPLPVVQADPTLLRQVLVNLLSNAIKYSRLQTNPTIEVGCQPALDEHCIYVKDNGVGFNMEHADKLFKVFNRLHHDSEFEGTGVGLAIVERIITRHGGRVWAEGSPGKGATFYFTLPKGG